MSRHVTLEGVDNFRDFGDYPAARGRRLKVGRLYRSASHGRATDDDLAAIADLEIAVIVDLRRKAERLRDPSRRPPGFAGLVIDNDDGEEEEDSWRAHIRSSDLSEASFRAYMFDYYRSAPFETRHRDLFARYFQALGRAEGPVLIHCAAGKDRTGLLAALTHHAAGVHADDIIADYLLTNDPARMARRLPVVAQLITEIAGRAPTDAAMLTAMGVEAAYLDAAFAAIKERHGGLDAYLEHELGVDRALREDLEARLLS